MTQRSVHVLAAVALLAGAVACGSDSPSQGSPSATPPHSTHSTDSGGGGGGATVTPPHDFPAAQQVTIMRSGGLKPGKQTLVFAMDRPAPRGFTERDVAAVLKAAADPELKDPPSDPGNTCCDMYVYRVTISYPDGTSSTFSAVQGTGASPAVDQLIALASASPLH